MSAYIGIGFVGALLLALLDPRSGMEDRAIRLGMRWFAIFAVISASVWIVNPAGTARLVVAAGSGRLTQQIVQGRGAIVLVFGLLSLVAARDRPDRTWPAMIGPLAYNALMTIEAIRAQFTPIVTPERWFLVICHAAWAIGFAGYIAAGGGRVLPRRLAAPDIFPALAALAAIACGGTLFVMPHAFITADAADDPLLFHSAHVFGASLIAAGLAAAAIEAGDRHQRRGTALGLGLACGLLAYVAFSAGHGGLAAGPLAGGIGFVVLFLGRGDRAGQMRPA